MKKRILTLLLAVPMLGNAQVITTIAGCGSCFTSGYGIPAVTRDIGDAGKTVIDRMGNFYIANTNESSIQKVDGLTGIITLVAGTGAGGFSGDGGPADIAMLNRPTFMAIDTLDNLYITDSYNERIRKVRLSTGIITTIAGTGGSISSGDGGPATDATLGDITGIAVDYAQNVYFADAYRIRRIDGVTGIITHYAGTGGTGFTGDGGSAATATLYDPQGICIDAAGNLYIADWVNERVRKINTLGIISTVAGNGAPPTYVADGVPATSAPMEPLDVATDLAGNLYIADRLNERIRMVDALGIVHTVAGNGVAGFSGDGGNPDSAQFFNPTYVAIDACNSIYISDFFNSRIRKVTVDSGCFPVAAVTVTGASEVCVGATDTLHPSIFGGFWTSSSPAVATAGPTGVVTGVTAGIVTISYSAGTATATKTITVKPSPSAGNITGDKIIICPGETLLLADTATGGTWSSSNTAFATVSPSGIVTGMAFGPDTIIYKVTNADFGCSTEAIYPLLVYCEGSVRPINASPEIITISPNPSFHTITVTASFSINSLTITNAVGQIVLSREYNAQKVTIDIEGLPAGVYFVKADGLIRRFVKG